MYQDIYDCVNNQEIPPKNKNDILGKIKEAVLSRKGGIGYIIIKGSISKLLQVNISKLLDENKYGSLFLLFFKNMLSEIIDTLKDLQDIDYKALSFSERQELEKYIDSVKILFQKLEKHDGSQKEKDALFAEIDSIKDSPEIKNLVLINKLEKIKDTFTGKEQEYNEKLNEIQKAATEANGTLKFMQQASGEVAASGHSVIFKEEANRHKKNSKVWLIVASFITLAIILLAKYLLGVDSTIVDNPTSAWQNQLSDKIVLAIIVKNIVAKLIVFSTLFFVLALVVKSYKVNKHNEILNSHRHNTLNTFKSFISAAGDDKQTKNAILLQTVQSIFSHQSTGYNDKESDPVNPNTKILEIIRDYVKTGKE